jgi:hypothetical protein
MPIYEFLCQRCGKGFVFSSSISEYERKRTEGQGDRILSCPREHGQQIALVQTT